MLTDVRHEAVAFHLTVQKRRRALETANKKTEMVFLVCRFVSDDDNRVDMIGHNHMLTQHHLGVLERQFLKYLLHPFTQFIQNAFIAYNCPQYGHIVCNLNRHKKIAPFRSRYFCSEEIDENAFSAYQGPVIIEKASFFFRPDRSSKT